MNKKQIVAALVLVFVGSFLGGLLATSLFVPQEVAAKPRRLLNFPQETPRQALARGLAAGLAGNSGIYTSQDGSNRARLTVQDKAGRARISLCFYDNGEPTIFIYNQAGQVIWRAR